MNDEIKEILDDLLFTTTLPNVSVKLSKEKLNQLKDCITNLEQENERLKKEQLNLKDELASMWECKARNKEAIEYIKNVSRETLNNGRVFYNELPAQNLLNILTGGDEE